MRHILPYQYHRIIKTIFLNQRDPYVAPKFDYQTDVSLPTLCVEDWYWLCVYALFFNSSAWCLLVGLFVCYTFVFATFSTLLMPYYDGHLTFFPGRISRNKRHLYEMYKFVPVSENIPSRFRRMSKVTK